MAISHTHFKSASENENRETTVVFLRSWDEKFRKEIVDLLHANHNKKSVIYKINKLTREKLRLKIYCKEMTSTYADENELPEKTIEFDFTSGRGVAVPSKIYKPPLYVSTLKFYVKPRSKLEIDLSRLPLAEQEKLNKAMALEDEKYNAPIPRL